MRTFRYYTGEVVIVDDRVIDCKRPARILDIFQPGPESAEHYQSPEGAVATSASRLWTPPDGEFWEDLEFVSRRPWWRFWR